MCPDKHQLYLFGIEIHLMQFDSWLVKKYKMLILRYCFNLACFSTAVGMTFYWLVKYMKDEDGVQVNLNPSEKLTTRQRPLLSLCFQDPFIESKLHRYNKTLTGKKYRMILKGESAYDGIEKIDFDDVTLNMTDFYLGDSITFRNGTSISGDSPNFLNQLPRVTYSGFWDFLFLKCFGLRIE